MDADGMKPNSIIVFIGVYRRASAVTIFLEYDLQEFPSDDF